ncbi:hypothetical protein [Sulfurihydrogenibium sp.]|uniref:hypothetical protein n=1 Tax=Sulfurihydrogenibium sp. TaxID=2053621 RepID=UPI00262929DD|nr:hypothetical protein [Sulfurihydrogenibium sp.]
MKKLKIFILENLPLKILSFIVAFLLWLNVTAQTQSKVQIYSYVDVIDIPGQLDIKKIKPEKVKITLEGKIMEKPDTIKVKAFVRGEKLKEGKNQLPVEVILDSSRYKIISVEPENVIIYAYKISSQNEESK